MSVDVARYRELAIQRITYTHDEYGTAKLSAALHLTQQALAEAASHIAALEAELADAKNCTTLRDQIDDLMSQLSKCGAERNNLRESLEPFVRAWGLVAQQPSIPQRLSNAQLAELACHELSSADFQRASRILGEKQ